MQPTLFYIPHTWLGWPLLVLWLLVCAALCGHWWRRGTFKSDAAGFLPVAAMVAAAILFVLPSVEVMGVNPQDPLRPMINRGLAIRGYGLCMLLAIVAGMGLVMLRCRRIGFPIDPMFSLSFCMVIFGVIGARLFFVIQKRDQFFGPDIPLSASLKEAVNMTEGGLVVYGSLIGASIAAAVFLWWTKLPLWKTADLFAPAMAIGLAIGRIGCLMNGCCWGGVCDANLPAIQFPAGSSPWVQHLSTGALLGLTTAPASEETGDRGAREVIAVDSEIAADQPIVPGDRVALSMENPDRIRFLKERVASGAPVDPSVLSLPAVQLVVEHEGTPRLVDVPLSRLPAWSLSVHPTQIYSSINAGLLTLLLWFWWYRRRADGEVFAIMLILYPVGRFLIEIIRNDEAGQFGTELTISQWVSLATVLVGFAIFAWCRTTGTRTDEPVQQ